MFKNLKLNKVVAIVVNFILVFELVGWSAIFNYQVKATSPTFEMFVNSESFESTGTAIAPAFNFHVKNGYSGNLNLQLADLNVPDNTQFGISPFSDQLNLSGVPGYVTKSNASEISKLNVPLGGENQWNGFLLSISSFGSGETSQTNTFKIIATAGDYSQEKTITIRYTYQSGDPIYTNINPDWSDGYRHTVNAGSSSTFKMATTSNYDGTINLTGLTPPAEGMSSTIPNSLNMVKDESGAMEIEGNKFLYTINTTSQTPNGYYFVSVKTTQVGGPDIISTTRVRVNNSQSGSSSSSNTDTSSNNNSSSQSSSSSTSSNSTASNSNSSSTSKQLGQTVQKQENQIANATNTDEAGSLDDTQGELTISPESGLTDTKITLTGKNYPKNTDLKILLNPFNRYIKEKTNWDDKPPFRLVGLIDWGIAKTDDNGEFSTYRVFDTTSPIIQSLTGKNTIRVGEDKIFNGQMGSSDHTFNDKITKAFIITIPIDDISQKQTESTSQIWTGKTSSQLSDSEKVAVANLTAGLTDPMYNQPFSEEKIPTNQKVVSYTISGNLGPDGKKCKMDIKPENYAYKNNPLKTLASNIFKFIPTAMADNATDVVSQALEDCPKTVTLADFWKSPIAQKYTFGKISDESNFAKVSDYLNKLQQISFDLKNIIDIDNTGNNNDVNKQINSLIKSLGEINDIPGGTKLLAGDNQEIQVDLTEYLYFLNTYCGLAILIMDDINSTDIDKQISDLNNLIENHAFFKTLKLPKIDKDAIKSTLQAKVLSNIINSASYYSVIYTKSGTCVSTLTNVEQIKNNCSITYSGAIKTAIDNANTKKEVDDILSQLADLSRNDNFKDADSNKSLLLFAYYAQLRKEALPGDYTDEGITQSNKVLDQKYLAISTRDLPTILQIKTTLPVLGKEINKSNALLAYHDLVSYVDIKYRYLINKDDSKNTAGIDYQMANTEMDAKITSTNYPYFEDAEFLDNINYLDDIYWQMILTDDANQISTQKKLAEDYKSKLKSDTLQVRINDLIKYADVKNNFLTGKISGFNANNEISSTQYYLFTPFLDKIEDFNFSMKYEGWLNKIVNQITLKKVFAKENATTARYYFAEAQKITNDANVRLLTVKKQLREKSIKPSEAIDKLNYALYLLNGKSGDYEKSTNKYFSLALQMANNSKADTKDYENWKNNKMYKLDTDINNLKNSLYSASTQTTQSSQSSSDSLQTDFYKLKVFAIGDEKKLIELQNNYSNFRSYGASGKSLRDNNSEEYKKIQKSYKDQANASGKPQAEINATLADPASMFVFYVYRECYGGDKEKANYYDIVSVQGGDKPKVYSPKQLDKILLPATSKSKKLFVQKVNEGVNGTPEVFDNAKQVLNTMFAKTTSCDSQGKKTSFLGIKSTYATNDKCLDATEINSNVLDAEKRTVNSSVLNNDDISKLYAMMTQAEKKRYEDEFGPLPKDIMDKSLDSFLARVRLKNFIKGDKYIGGIPEKLTNTIVSIYSGGIPKDLTTTFSNLVGMGFRPKLDPELEKNIRNAAINGKCGYQEFECTNSFNTASNVSNKCAAVILCDNGPTAGSTTSYGTSFSSNTQTHASSGIINTVFASDSTQNDTFESYYTNFIHLSSDKPVGILIIDPSGRAVGWNPISQNEVNQIVNTSYSGIGSANPEMLLRGLTEGSYRIRLLGLDDGPYKVNLAIATEDQVWTKTYQGMIKKNEIINGNFDIGMNKISTLTLSQKIIDNPYYKFGGLSLIVLIILGGAYYYIHNKNQLKFWHLKP
ncbi:MAG: hypothetical protein ACD_58C00244G0002 [uncultured bacterium]|nr:MAG: hypothetical protein ACD_58C00244G0002 [uncultured bacterium]